MPGLRTAVLWARFGPYHLARLDAAHDLMRAHGEELVGIETASRDGIYAWRVERSQATWAREVALPERVYEAASAAEMHAAVTETLDRVAPDAVAFSSYATPDARAALAWCRRHRAAAVLMTDSRANDAPRAAWREWVKRILVREADAALVAGSQSRAYAVSLGMPPDAVFSPLDVVDSDAFARAAAGSRSPLGGAPYFLSVSRLTTVKNVSTLIEAYRAYRSGEPEPWSLVIVGDGSEREGLQAAAPDGVVFTGFLQIEHLAAFYAHTGGFVLPTWKDTWGLVVNEAMACGAPVLVSGAAGCAADLVRDGVNGFVFDPADAEGLAELLRRLANAPSTARRAMGEHSRAIIADYGPHDFARALRAATLHGQDRAARGLSLRGALALGVLRRLARRPGSFHAIPD